MPMTPIQVLPESSGLSLEQQVVRLQALLEAARRVHSTILLEEVLREAARSAVLELELEGAAFCGGPSRPDVCLGDVPEKDSAGWQACPRFALQTRDGEPIAELVVAPPEGRALSLYETDFLEGLALQTAIAAENALHHQRNHH